jgi:hypothetical protein
LKSALPWPKILSRNFRSGDSALGEAGMRGRKD